MERTIVATPKAPAAIGPYSQAVVVPAGTGKMIFCSGQIPLDPETGALVEGDIADQTFQVLANLRAVLEAADATFANIVKTTIYLVDLSDFAAVNKVYGEAFEGVPPPARATIQVSRLPKDSRVEIDAIAVA